ncbi:sulfotransferase [Salinisphaera aquimarina]|uniref:Sulfotransferase n=1 Tax=Salinisphaera aquimarina TaxID=2094031 RepID=A0ABV7ET01_9GAMM
MTDEDQNEEQSENENPRTARSAPSDAAIASFAVPTWMHRVGGWQQRHPRAAIKLGNFDTRMAGDAIADIAIDAPIYVAGLARSGTTILLELLAAHPEVGTHQYRDFPPIFTPWLWDRWLARVPQPDETATERAHGDGIAVTSRSPEAFEEVLWMAFFPDIHDPGHSSLLDRDTDRPDFARFYAEHMRKVLAVRGARRYLAKGNYNLMRLSYLQTLFKDASFLLPIRDPVWHIASLMKQQRLFEAGEKAHPRALEHMRRVGHFEFGLDRRAINPGDNAAVEHIEKLWADGQEVEGWARYWALVYADLKDRLESDARLNDACLVVRFEDMCRDSLEILRQVYSHCGLSISDDDLATAADRLHEPGYYKPAFSDAELEQIREITGPVAARYGYANDNV